TARWGGKRRTVSQMGSRVPARTPLLTVRGTSVGPSPPSRNRRQSFASIRLTNQRKVRCNTPTRRNPVGSEKFSIKALIRRRMVCEYQTGAAKMVWFAATTRRNRTGSRISRLGSAIVVGNQPSYPCRSQLNPCHHGRRRYRHRSIRAKYLRIRLAFHDLLPVSF